MSALDAAHSDASRLAGEIIKQRDGGWENPKTVAAFDEALRRAARLRAEQQARDDALAPRHQFRETTWDCRVCGRSRRWVDADRDRWRCVPGDAAGVAGPEGT